MYNDNYNQSSKIAVILETFSEEVLSKELLSVTNELFFINR